MAGVSGFIAAGRGRGAGLWCSSVAAGLVAAPEGANSAFAGTSATGAARTRNLLGFDGCPCAS